MSAEACWRRAVGTQSPAPSVGSYFPAVDGIDCMLDFMNGHPCCRRHAPLAVLEQSDAATDCHIPMRQTETSISARGGRSNFIRALKVLLAMVILNCHIPTRGRVDMRLPQ